MMASFDPAKDIGDLSGKVIVVTGGTAGLGRETICQFATHGAPRIFFTGRNQNAANDTISAAKAVNSKAEMNFIACDFSDLKAVATAAGEITGACDKIDIVVCNAGIMATPAGLSKDGYEIQFAVNHLGHALLIKKLLLQRTSQQGGDARVIVNSSLGFQFAQNIEFDTLNTKQEAYILGAFRRYGQSKLANILYPAELARRYPEITFVSIHPGIINTGLISGLSAFNRYFTQITTIGKQVSVQEGAKNQLWAATVEKSSITNGAFYEPVGKPGVQTAASKNQDLAHRLYDWTEEAMQQF